MGRRVCVGIGCSLVITAGCIQASIQNHWVYFGCRVLAGFGAGISQTAAPLLTTESAHPRQRQTLTALYNACWCWGSITSAAVTFGTLRIANSWSWRIPCLMQAFFPTLQLLGLCFVPESPRWLVSKNRSDEALVVLAKYHANGVVEDELVQYEFQQICTSINAEVDRNGSSWSSFFSSWGDIHRLSICVWVGIMQEWAGTGMNPTHLLLSCSLADPRRHYRVLSGPDLDVGGNLSPSRSSLCQREHADLESDLLRCWCYFL